MKNIKQYCGALRHSASTILLELPFFFVDSFCLLFAITLSMFFASDAQMLYSVYLQYLPVYWVAGVVLISFVLYLARCYSTKILHFSVNDAIRLGFVLMVGYVLYMAFNRFLALPLPLPVMMNAIMLNTLFLGAYRLILRSTYWIYGRLNSYTTGSAQVKKVLIVGAGDAGKYLCDLLTYDPSKGARVVGFIDDNDELWGKTCKGITVLGGRAHIPKAATKLGADEIIIAIPHVDNYTIREIFGYCTQADCNIRRFANMTRFTGDGLAKATINEVKLEDLLGRDEIKLDMGIVKELLENKVVLVTGGAGSIGSEICRQICQMGIQRLVVFDFNENGLFDLNNELREKFPGTTMVPVLGSVRDKPRLDEVFGIYKPQIVFHAAAHKHVPMMELNPFEAVINNVIGTDNTARTSIRHKAEKFILISTDKAVNPTNIMGASKRMAEIVVQNLNAASRTTSLSAVRFGNVLGSNGSVIPTFRRQIQNGGPITVTHRDITRYFMTIPEAVHLVLEASAIAKGSEIFVLNMGQPMRIYDLACTMIRLSGLIPDKDIKVEITGLRPGEKLFEEINLDSENVTPTQNDQIFILKSNDTLESDADNRLETLFSAAANRDMTQLGPEIKYFVPSFFNARV